MPRTNIRRVDQVGHEVREQYYRPSMKSRSGLCQRGLGFDLPEVSQPVSNMKRVTIQDELASDATGFVVNKKKRRHRAPCINRATFPVEPMNDGGSVKKTRRGQKATEVTTQVSFDNDIGGSGVVNRDTLQSPAPTAPLAVKKKKRGRGATCMPKIWCQRDRKKIDVAFNDIGQPIDEENNSTLAHFLGTIARDGRHCPLFYKDWRLMPYQYKKDMLALVKAKFALPPGSDSYILKSINKKWKSWKSSVKRSTFKPIVPIEAQLSEIPSRVDEDQYKILAEHWMLEKTNELSLKNKRTRGNLSFLHRMGKTSMPIVKERLRKRFGRCPTKAEMYQECFYKDDGSEASKETQAAIDKMKALAGSDPQYSNDKELICDPNDAFTKIMGKDKNGPRMYGLGITDADVNGKLSRDALTRQCEEYKQKYLHGVERLDEMNEKFEKFQAYVNEKLNANEQPNTHRASPNRHCNSESIRFASSDPEHSFASNSRHVHIRVGSYVVLKSLGDKNEIVAAGIVECMDNVTVNGMNLGSNFCQIIIQGQVKRETGLLFPYSHIQTIGDALGAPVAWPLSLVALDEDENDY